MLTCRPDNLVPALKKSTISTFEHSLVLSENRTISSTNWENQHYFETLSALTLKIRTSFNHCSKFECWKRLRNLCSKCHVKFEDNSDNDCKSRWHFGAGLANCAKRACMLLSICYQMVISCNTVGVATSPNVADLSTSFNGMNLNIVVLPIIIIWHSVRWISGALNEHYLKSRALNRALNAEKTRDAQSTKSKFYEH